MAGLWVIEIFDSLQGEGFWTGVPMTFVRLAGCNAPALGLGCVRWCDTPASWSPESGAELEPSEILDRVGLPRLCLTGGEPLLQAEAAKALVVEAHRRGVRVHVETNGTLPPPGTESEAVFDWVVVSPKPPDYLIAPGWEGLIDELKLIVDEQLDAATAERLAARHAEVVVSIQPEWGSVPEDAGRGGKGSSIARAIGLVMEHPDWRLSLQIHKYLGIR